jgi:hypothetical protein
MQQGQPAGLRHLVLCAFRPDLPDAERDHVVREFLALGERVASVRAVEWGLNVSPEGLDGGHTHCFTFSFDDAAGRDAYLVDPAHLRFVDLIKPALARLIVLDYLPQARP